MAEAPPFGELLRRHRIAAGLSQESLAERARISAAAVSALERGARNAPYRVTVALLASALDLSATATAELQTAAARGRVRGAAANRYAGPRHNLPVQLTSFVGRDEELIEITSLLKTHRLLTVTGSGGVGKTRVAIEAARRLLGERYEEACFVDLVPVTDGALVPAAIAAALDLRLDRAPDPLEGLEAALKRRQVLLIIDNCEHVTAGAATAIGAIVRGCTEVIVLATSRERLAIEGEVLYRLPSLRVPTLRPSSVDEARSYPSLQLFMERTSALDSQTIYTRERLEAASDICRQLEGIPLAIELAATRASALGLDELRRRLKEHFVLTGGNRDLPQRQRTMIATVAWSYDLLSDAEKTLLRRMSVFRGSVPLEGIEAVCSEGHLALDCVADGVASLVDKSLVMPSASKAGTRYVMLESVRAFASAQLREEGAIEASAQAHARWMASLADRGGERLQILAYDLWFEEFYAEIENARAALEWSLSTGKSADVLLAARIVGGLRMLWLLNGMEPECVRWVEEILDRIDIAAYPLVSGPLMRAYIQAASSRTTLDIAERVIAILENASDQTALVVAYIAQSVSYGKAGAFVQADLAIRRAFAQADAQGLQHSSPYLFLLAAQFDLCFEAGRLAEAEAFLAELKALEDALGQRNEFRRAGYESMLAFLKGDLQSALREQLRQLESRRAQGAAPAFVLGSLAITHLALNDDEAAEAYAREALELHGYRDPEKLLRSVIVMAAVAARRGRPVCAARVAGFFDAWHVQQGLLPDQWATRGREILRASLSQHLAEADISKAAAEGALFDIDRAIDQALAL